MTSDAFFNRCREWLEAHAERYREAAGDDAPLIDRKLRHTRRVLDHARHILRELPEDRPDLARLAEIAALLHDAGRFPQLVRKRTYDDRSGYNHAEAGAEIVARSGLLDGLPAAERGLILDVVRLHNVAVPPAGLPPDTRLVLEVVRNADKLDAIRNNLKYLNPEAPHGKALKLGVVWDPEGVSDEALRLARERRLIPFPAIHWSNDFVLFLCCWIYDLRFHYSFDELRRSGRYEALLARLPDSLVFVPLKARFREDLARLAAADRPWEEQSGMSPSGGEG